MSDATMEQTAVVTLSEAAADKLLAIMDEKGVRHTHALRVFVAGGGCNGIQYGMGFDSNTRPVDTVCEQHGLRVIVDPRSLPYVEGVNIDFLDSPTGGGFQIENPNMVSSCSARGCNGCR